MNVPSAASTVVEPESSSATNFKDSQTIVRKRRPKWAYLLGALGGLLVVVSTFLPWLSANARTINQHLSISGLGALTTTSPGVANLNQLPRPDSGSLTLLLGGVALLLALLSFFLNRIEMAAILVVFGLFSLAVVSYLMGDTNAKLDQFNSLITTYFQSVQNGLHVEPPIQVGVGYGLFLGMAGAGLVALSGILALTGKQPQPQPKKRS